MSQGNRLFLVLGGARAGKSAFAQALAEQLGREVVFLATAEAKDEEMARRIAEHCRRRPAHWRTIEEPLHPAPVLPGLSADVVVLDCLTVLVANLLLEAPEGEAQAAVEEEVAGLLHAFAVSQATAIVVSNEVGLGVVPPSPLGRAYRDLLGWANQQFARAADRVYWMLAGLPMELKASNLAVNWGDTGVAN